MPAFSFAPISAAERAPAAMASQIVVRPTPKQAQTIGPALASPSADLPDSSMRRWSLLERIRGEQALDDVPVAGVPRGTDEQAGLDAVAAKGRRAIDAAAKILVFGEIVARERFQPGLPSREVGIVSEQIAVTAIDGDARRPGMRGQFERLARQRKAPEHIFVWRDRGRRRLVLGLAGERIGVRRHQRTDARAGALASLQWIGANSMPRCWRSLTTTRKRALPVIGRDPRKIAVGDAVFRGIIGMNLDERLRQMLAEPRARRRCGSWCAIDPGCGRCSAATAARPWSRSAAPEFPAR